MNSRDNSPHIEKEFNLKSEVKKIKKEIKDINKKINEINCSLKDIHEILINHKKFIEFHYNESYG